MSDLLNAKIDSLSVVIPVFNEEKIIERSLRALADTLKHICLDYEILVVNDGSTDRTALILDNLAKSMNSLRVLSNTANQGLGGALQYGFREAGKALVFYTDSDMPFQYSEIIQAARMMQLTDVDIIAGFRKNRTREAFLRRLCSMAYNVCVRGLYGVRLRDINCAFKLIRSRVFKNFALKSRGSFIDAELVVRSQYLGFSIQEFGVEYHPRQEGDSRLFRLYPIMKTFWEMAKLYPEIRRLKPAAAHKRGVA